jgi:hypothetical protein
VPFRKPTEDGMSTNTPPAPASGEAKTERVFVAIPKAGPGQGYKAPKNYEHPFFDFVGRVFTIVLCASLPLAPAIIMALIVFLPQKAPYKNALQEGFLGLWIVMFVLVEALALFCAIGLAREALGSAGSGDYER